MSALGFIATNDLVAITRGRAVPLTDLESSLATGCGWVPANLGIGPFGQIVHDGVFGATGDLRLIPDPTTRTVFAANRDHPPLTVMLGNVCATDGTPWAACPRTFLLDAVADLASEFGLQVLGAFEHEFMLDERGRPSPPFSLEALHRGEPFGSDLVTAMATAGLALENWLPEYGPNQWEVVVAPNTAVQAADRAVLLRDLVRYVAEAHGRKASFSPLLDPAGTGNGVHCHLSLRDLDGVPKMFDAGRPGRLSARAGSFAAGILKHSRAIVAMTAPTAISYLRLVPGRWSAGYAFLGERNREALLRVCPTVEIGGKDPAKQLNIEFRAGDAGANPWLFMGLLIRAGLEGLRAELPTPTIIDGEIDEVSEQDRAAAGVQTLPASLTEALEVLQSDTTVTGWLAPELLGTYLAIKSEELAALEGLDEAERCAAYQEVY